MDRRARCGSVCFALILASACKFEPPLASEGAHDAAVNDASRVDSGGGTDGSIIDGSPTDAGEVDGSLPDATPDGGGTTTARMVYLPAAGGGHLSGAQHQASIIVGGSAAELTATSSTHRVQFGGSVQLGGRQP